MVEEFPPIESFFEDSGAILKNLALERGPYPENVIPDL